MASLIFLEGPRAGQELELPEGGLLLGRTGDVDLTLDDLEVSGHHAEIRLKDGAWFITDLNSSNGTSVNGKEIASVRLADGDVAEVGHTRLRFRADGVPDGGAPGGEAQEAGAATREDLALVRQMSRRTDAIRREVGKVIVGQREVVEQVLMCLIANGHGLLIGLPGMAKTLIVRTVARVLDLTFKRVQFTPDLMPAYIIGSDGLETNRETGEKELRFIRGPIFCNLLLADEINRTPPKTQAALLEAMQENRVTAGNTTYEMDQPFFVLATQNPIEQEGTYPLPEAQLDRFMFNIWVDYPLEAEEEQIIGVTTSGDLAEPACVLKKEEVLRLQKVVQKIPVSPHVVKYVIRLVRATRPGYPDSPEITRTYVSTGAGPRAGQYLVLAAKAKAVLDGRIHVSCNDIRRAALPVLRHRLLTNFAADSEGLTSMDVVRKLLETVEEPGPDAY